MDKWSYIKILKKVYKLATVSLWWVSGWPVDSAIISLPVGLTFYLLHLGKKNAFTALVKFSVFRLTNNTFSRYFTAIYCTWHKLCRLRRGIKFFTVFIHAASTVCSILLQFFSGQNRSKSNQISNFNSAINAKLWLKTHLAVLSSSVLLPHVSRSRRLVISIHA